LLILFVVVSPGGVLVIVRAGFKAAVEGAVKLLGVERDEGVAGYRVVLIGVVSASCGKADYVVPGGEAGGHLVAFTCRVPKVRHMS
jgi:hypothetical protein